KKKKKVNNLKLRARTPAYFRALALGALAVTILAIGVGFYLNSGTKDFRMKGLPTQLSKDVVAVVNGFERREVEGDTVKYYIKADRATTFSDNHQELENVYLEVYNPENEKPDKISANRAVYIPAENKNFNAYFSGAVNVETRDGLRVKSERISYDKATEIAESEELVEFSRENISGKSTGAKVFVKDKRLELLSRVEIDAFAGETAQTDELARANVQSARITSGRAVLEQQAGRIRLEQNVNINLIPKNNSGALSQPTDVRAEKVTAFFTEKEINRLELADNVEVFIKPTDANRKYTKTRASRAVATFEGELKRIELNENVEIESTSNDAKLTRIRAQQAVYEKSSDKFDLRNNVEIVTVEDEKPTTIRAQEAIYEQTNGKIFLGGGAEITQAETFIKGDRITTELFANKKVRSALVYGSAYLKQSAPERTTEVSANELNANFAENQQVQNAKASGSANVTLVPSKPEDYTKATMFAPVAVRLAFANNALSRMQTEGRTTISLAAPQGKTDASNKKLIADAVKTDLSAGGRDILRAEAVGNAELYVEPLQAKAENYKTTVNAPRFDCDFYAGNNPKICAATQKAKAVQVPTVAGENRGTRTLTAEKLISNFNQKTHDIERFDATGNAKFTELDRSGSASQIIYTANDEIVRLRGSEPTVWDSVARVKANEIDWDTRSEKSFLRGRVSTTYYSQKQSNGSTPFGKTSAPVFVTAERADFDHQTEVGVYTGNARAWQENNYVRAEKLVFQQKAKRMDGEGKVQSLLYNAKRKENGKEITQPVFAQSERISYTDQNRQLRYEGNVDIRQGTDRIVAGVTDVFLNENNEVMQTIAQNNVVVTQPNRRAAGDYAQYTTADEMVVLRGSPASVEDAEQGSSQSAQLTVYLRENRVLSQGTSKQSGTGRIRSVYKVKKQ
ncbi:MAG TPA: LPS export ABC transporter periplasmic protein LptC, partial [Pyrinomonadaceae bacterium]|nr:LPS export ABC transporter periplasmic protein LptC [Pyrinomonadaceae bacterium]